jgi:hypothetical protein
MKSSATIYSAHNEVWVLLPWYVNGTLTGEQHHLVHQHLRVCIACRRELAAQQALSQAVYNSPDIELNPHTSFSRLLKRIDDETQQLKASRGWRSRIRTQWQQLSGGWEAWRAPRAAFALISLLAVGLVVAIGWRPEAVSQAREPLYHTLASPPQTLAKEDYSLRVVFAKTMQRADIDQLLASINGKEIGEPSPFGVYTVKVSGKNSLDADVVSAMEQLRNHEGVLFVEPHLTNLRPANLAGESP